MASEFNMLMLRHLSRAAVRYIPVVGLLAAAVIQAQGTPIASPSAGDASPSAAKPASDHRLVDRWALGGEGGWDYPTVDSAAHRLYLSRATRVAVIDTRTGKSVGEVPDTPGVHGIALAADFRRGYASAGNGEGTLTVVHEGPDPQHFAVAETLLVVGTGRRAMTGTGVVGRITPMRASGHNP
jgi:hypothetical protein